MSFLHRTQSLTRSGQTLSPLPLLWRCRIMVMQAFSTLDAFISEERNHYANPGVNLFAFALGQAARYDQFLRIILHRHKANAAEWQRAVTAWLIRISEVKDGPLNRDEMPDWYGQ